MDLVWRCEFRLGAWYENVLGVPLVCSGAVWGVWVHISRLNYKLNVAKIVPQKVPQFLDNMEKSMQSHLANLAARLRPLNTIPLAFRRSGSMPRLPSSLGSDPLGGLFSGLVRARYVCTITTWRHRSRAHRQRTAQSQAANGKGKVHGNKL